MLGLFLCVFVVGCCFNADDVLEIIFSCCLVVDDDGADRYGTNFFFVALNDIGFGDNNYSDCKTVSTDSSCP